MSRMRTLIGAAMLAVLTTACASGASGDDTAEVAAPSVAPTTAEAGPETPDTEAPDTEAPTSMPDDQATVTEVEDADDRLLIAAVIVATGSLDEALEAGVVTPAEVEAAIVAVQTGALGAAIES